jgi:CxxC-x17-CxxC domain-containing protein
MGNFNSNRSDRSRDSNRGSEGPQMHQAECSKCGKSCLVPFKPTGNRPIFCADCFKTEGGRRSDERSSQTPGERKMYDAVCDNCGNRCQIPFQPKSGKPVYCSHCFEQREKEGKGFRDRPQNNDQFASLNAKLDKILALLTTKEPLSPVAPEVKKAIAAIEEVVVVEEDKPAKKPAKKAATKKKTTKKKPLTSS